MSRSTSFAISGTNWIAEAPVPITATLRPARSCEWSHSAEWKTLPVKVSMPSTRGTEGRVSWPQAVTSRSNDLVSPESVVSVQRPSEGSKRASVTSVPSRRCGRISKRSVISSM